jgi:hypothetical protein
VKPPRRPAHAEVVGSLLRPPALREAVEGFYTNGGPPNFSLVLSAAVAHLSDINLQLRCTGRESR